MYVCECGKEFDKVSSYGGHCANCKIHLGYEPCDKFGDSRAWSRGKTKETDPRLAKISDNKKQLIADGKIKPPFSGKHHTIETRKKMSESAKIVTKDGRNGWKCGDSHVQNKYEKLTSKFLTDHDIPYQSEVTVSKSDVGCKGSYYQLDFLIDGRIDLEIDGTVHLTEKQANHDKERGSLVEKLYTVYRIQHHDNSDVLEKELNCFLDYFYSKDDSIV